MNRRFQPCVFALFALCAAHGADDMTFFESRVLPVLQSRCYECHSHEGKIKGGLALDLKSGWQTGGDTGPAIVPGNPDRSLLIQAVRYADPDREMPPKGKLAAGEIEVLEKWVAMGAPDPRTSAVAARESNTIDIDSGRKFWAFGPVQNVEAPAVRDASWQNEGGTA